ncbi:MULTISPECIES: DNA gyrase inhibitor YacG [unclassified Gilliamella]|uniref:DNA gyrase inhibitor YacG n=1 Tax=unclassified Gilliamella TaxID=2685620 RepID=UPI00130ADCEF|nr:MULTISPECIES: DNA gyrase inhibitor YacG [unclassified Gilliamella]MWP49579.1 DNA gyrase inhibitor YacG [Gilliamella sp. Lep-s35]MWP69344.1 DNA gyrase inhibitor YacG [Gilliamella sp. Lep-s5]MWP77613.1 DNA gyrase inhibitor YacG [Gilliamella sp. Lep-s21]
MNKQTVTYVNCPTCQKQVIWSKKDSPYRPFCSKRCQLIDLGAWATEEHRIADKDITEQDLWSEEDLSDFTGRH